MIPIIDSPESYLNFLDKAQNPFFPHYYAFYSSWLGAITTNPRYMLLPIDDHMVHRGDGVFETCKAVNRRIYLLDEHLERLAVSSEKIGIQTPFSQQEIKEIIIETLKVANKENVSIRIYLSRGPGYFSVNPYDSIGPQLYIAITDLKSLPEKKYETGATIGISAIPVKVSWLAQVKSCNYLPNVLMKKEAVDKGLDFVIGVDDQGFIAEGSTENIILLDQHDTLIYPAFKYILRGTTLIRICDLAQKQGIQSKSRPFKLEDLLTAKEVMMTGTTLDVLSVTSIDGKNISDGKPGPLASQLRKLVSSDLKNGTVLY